MSGRGNRGFADLIVGEGARSAASRLPPRTGVLSGRENRLAELASGHAVTRVHELVDPARCRIWERHNRDYAALDETACADLIESMTAQGRQEVPAIVRRVSGAPGIDFEVICGARRHWTVTWLRAHDQPQFRFLVEPRELSDEEAFRISDLENRSRRDLSDHERARDYARAINLYYDGSQQRMAERLHVTRSWLSRYLELARLSDGILAAFGSPADVGISHAAILAPLLRAPLTRRQVEQAAAQVAEVQAMLRREGQTPLPAARVLATLVPQRRGPTPATRRATIRGDDGRVLASGERKGAGALVVTVPVPGRDRAAVLRAMEELLRQIGD